MKNKQKTKPINQGEWEKRFDDEFDHWVYLSDIKTGCNWNSFKSGIKSMFTYQRQQLIKEIEGIVGEDEFIDRTSDITKLPDGDYMDNPELDRRNQLRKEIKERLKQI